MNINCLEIDIYVLQLPTLPLNHEGPTHSNRRHLLRRPRSPDNSSGPRRLRHGQSLGPGAVFMNGVGGGVSLAGWLRRRVQCTRRSWLVVR